MARRGENIYKRGDGRWEGRIVVGHKQNGEPIFRYVLAKMPPLTALAGKSGDSACGSCPARSRQAIT